VIRRAAMLIVLVLLLSGSMRSPAVETVSITLPSTLSFTVTNASVSTTGNPNPTPISFSPVVVLITHVVHISVKADSDFVPPSGSHIPASKVSWTTSNAVQGVGSSGTLSTAAYSQVFQGNTSLSSGSVNVAWTLAAPGTPLRAGNHTMTMRWKVEAF